MDLDKFITAALTSIVKGVCEAQQQTSGLGAFVNPGGLERNSQTVSSDAIWDNSTNNYARLVSFDVAVTVEEGSKTDGRIGVVAGLFNLGAGGASENKQLAVSRIQFAVPVLLPAVHKPGGMDSKKPAVERPPQAVT